MQRTPSGSKERNKEQIKNNSNKWLKQLKHYAAAAASQSYVRKRRMLKNESV